MTQPDLAKIAALAATGAVLGYADPALAQVAACPEVNWPKAAISIGAIIAGVVSVWIVLR
jgi:hypothetical protein